MDIVALNQRIKKSGMKKMHIAKKAGIHYVHLSRILNGVTKNPRAKTIKRINQAIPKN